MFAPRSLAVIGASATPGKIGFALLKNVLASGFRGAVYPVNPGAAEIQGLKCYPDVGAIPGPVEMAVVAVPAALVVGVARECGEKGVRFLVVISAGFREIGGEGARRERELLAVCRRYGMRMLGPNCVGLMDAHTPLNASFAAGFPRPGEIAFISQSGAMLLAILDWSFEAGLGFSKFVSLGNKADLNEADFIAAAGEDPATRVILCYMEDVADGPRFLEVASRVTAAKPVVVLKSGTSRAGARAASSHTGALAGNDAAYEAAFRACGVIRARTMDELFHLAAALVRQPVPRGATVAVVTNAGGPGIVATDEIERAGLRVARFAPGTVAGLRADLPREAGIYNPVDVLGDATAERYRRALERVLADDGVDGVLVLLCPTAPAQPEETARAIVELHRRHPSKPVLAVYMGGATLEEGTRLLREAGIPCFTFPEAAVRALAGMVGYVRGGARARGRSAISFRDADRAAVREVLSGVREERRLVLLGPEALRVVAAYGIRVVPGGLATSAKAAVALAEEVGYPVALKVVSPQVLHKSDVGGVRLDLATAAEVAAAYAGITESVQRLLPGAHVYGIEVQKMLPPGTELILGMTRDLQFGPVLAFGLGGVYVNLLRDVAFRLAWGLGRRDIGAMVAETRAFRLLRGYRGERPADLPAVVEAIGRVAALVTDFPEIAELDINPLVVYPDGVVALDVKITVDEVRS
ncbi:MAG: acetate--CoA ligase family protein [Firmicutes bacterium]|nr:acetate--CoA ligase family protein [Bacillota bacterium]